MERGQRARRQPTSKSPEVLLVARGEFSQLEVLSS